MSVLKAMWNGMWSTEHRRVLFLCALVIVVVYSPAAWFAVAPKSGVASPKFTATSQQDKFGPEGLGELTQPGWHAKPLPKYPEAITVDLQARREIRFVALLKQDGQPARAPKAIRIDMSDDGSSWAPVTGSDNACPSDTPDGWSYVYFGKPATGRYLKVVIFSNCGDPQFLTLRGLRFG